MSEKSEELAAQLLEKTTAEKLQWFPINDSRFDEFRTDIGDGFAFYIQRLMSGVDDKIISFELRKEGNIVFNDQVDNLVPRSRAAAFMGGPPEVKMQKFRLFSDLFHAARKSGMSADQTIDQVQQLLERLG